MIEQHPAIVIFERWRTSFAKNEGLAVKINDADYGYLHHLQVACFLVPPSKVTTVQVKMGKYSSCILTLNSVSRRLCKILVKCPESNELLKKSFSKSNFFELWPDTVRDLSISEFLSIIDHAGGFDGSIKRFIVGDV